MTHEELIEELKPFHNHIGLVHDTDLVRLLGIVDGDDDYYYVVADLRGRVSWCSCVGYFESLKGKIERYDTAENLFTLNGCPPTEVFQTIP